MEVHSVILAAEDKRILVYYINRRINCLHPSRDPYFNLSVS